jgi:rhodanese-related sulfurtransferase
MYALTRTAVLVTALLLTFCASLLAAPYQEIGTLLLKAMLDKDKSILLIYPLSKIEYNDLHIAGSIFIPLDELKKKLPADHARPLVFYCLGEKCTASWRAAEIAANLGYQRVYAYRAGLPAWVSAGYPTASIETLPKIQVKKISTDELQQRLQSDANFALLDTSLEADTEKFRINSPKRIYIPFEELHDRYREIPRDKQIAVICLKGTRAPTAVRFLTAKGYNNVVSVEGGIEQWIMEKKPVVRGAGAKN